VTGLVYLASRHMLRRWGRSLVLIVCLAVAIALPLTSRVLVARFDRSLHARAATTPMVVGAKGSRFDLVFGAIYFRATDLGTTTMGRYDALRRERGIEAIPVHARFTVRGTTPIVATTLEYTERRGLRIADGRHTAFPGEVVLGRAAAQRLAAGVGDSLFSDQRRAYDITSAQAIKLHVVGVLADSASPDDDAAFVDLQTAWVLEGLTHGHTRAEEVRTPSLVIGQSDEHIALSAAVKEYQEITPENASTFHLHGDRAGLPDTLAGIYAPLGQACDVSSPFVWAAAPVPLPGEWVWWLVVATDAATTEGAWGANTAGERTGQLSGGASGACGVTAKDDQGACAP